MPRCFWCTEDPLYMAYHDQEWGTPLRDAQALFELLLLEGFQAGLSWITVRRKREHYRQVMYGFDVQRVAQMSDAEIDELMLDPGSSAIASSLTRPDAMPRPGWHWRIRWRFSGPSSAVCRRSIISRIAAKCRPITPEAVEMSKGLKSAGFTFVGPTICYAADAGIGHGHGPHPRLRSLRDAGQRRLEWPPRAQHKIRSDLWIS